MFRLGLLASHRGSNAQAIVNAYREGRLDAEPAVIISNNANAPVLRFAADTGIPHAHIGGPDFADTAIRDAAILGCLHEYSVDLVVLAGYMKLLGPRTVAAFRNRIINTHPALLPRHGGRGMYGLHVHEAVLHAGDTVTGITIHLVDEQYDHGATLAQRCVPVETGDSADSLCARVQSQERLFLVETIQAIATGSLKLPAS